MKKHLLILLALGLFSIASFGQLSVMIADENKHIASIDAATHAINTIDYEHHEIHGGSHYFIEDYVSLNSGDSVIFVVQTPNTTKWVHMVFGHQSGAGGYYFNVYEGVTEDGDGIAYNKIYNNNRNSSNTSILTITSGNTVTDNGTHIVRSAFGSSTGSSSNVGQDDRAHELILKANAKYMFTFKSKANSNDITFDVSWYEHTNKH